MPRSLSLSRVAAVAALVSISALSPVRADTFYLFAGDRIPDPAHTTGVHRFIFDTAAPKTAAPEVAGVKKWGEGNTEIYRGIGVNGLALGPDGDLYAVSNNLKSVLRIDGASGHVKKEILSGLKQPECLTIGKDRNLYISDNSRILRCKLDGTPLPGAEQIGATFAAGGQLVTASGLAFGPDGNLYVASQNQGRILRFDGRSGELIDIFHEGDFQSPGALAFGPDGHLYVASIGGPGFDAASGSVIKLNGKTGKFAGKFAPDAKGALGLAFGPNGNLFVSDYWTGKVTQYDAKTGVSLGVFAVNNPGTSFYNLVFAAQSASAVKLQSLLRPAAVKPKSN